MLRVSALAAVLALSSVACLGLGDDTEEVVSYENPPADPSSKLVDDTDPPATTYDATLDYKNRDGSIRNHSSDRFKFDVAAFRDDAEKAAANTLYPSHAAFLKAHAGDYRDTLPSVQTVGTYTKQLDDTIYAGVEHAVQAGLGATLASKRTILSGSLEHLLAHRSAAADDAAVYVAASLRLGDAAAAVPADLEGRVAAAMRDFTANPAISRPIGFYTWSDELRGIWAQDRFLQQAPASAGASCALAAAIGADAGRTKLYGEITALYSKLTNPLVGSLEGQLTTCTATAPLPFLAASESSETSLFESLYPNGVPADANLMQDLIDGIRNGTVDLAPKADAGWYQWQSYALETLLVTDKSEERAKIGFTAAYKKRLQEAFSTMLVQHRETHVKQLEGELTAVSVPQAPEFSVEPLATVYVRHARSYVFLEDALDASMGKDFLDTAVAVDANGATTDSLRTRIHHARDLFFGTYLVSSYELGMKPKLDSAGDPAASAWPELTAAAFAWLGTLAEDPIANADVRVLVPIASIDAAHTKYWAVIGVRATPAAISFIDGEKGVADVALATEQFLEVTSSNVPPTRDEFRALCDANPTADAIKAAMEKR